jgi:serine phosphatase RsbU (regulator of sigma subunit)
MTIFNFLSKIAKRLWPDITSLARNDQAVAIGELFGNLYGSLIALVGILWLAKISDYALFVSDWPMFLLFLLLIILFERLSFFMIVELHADQYGSSNDSLHSIITWSAVLIYGPTTLWLALAVQAVRLFNEIRSVSSTPARWNRFRSFILYLSTTTIPYIAGLNIYTNIGGTIPISNLDISNILQAMAGMVVAFSISLIIWLPYIIYTVVTQNTITGTSPGPLLRFIFIALILPALAHPFAILASGLYSGYNIWVFIYYMVGLILVAYLARMFSRSAEHSRQQSRQLDKLEKLGRAILNAPPDATTLPDILQEHLRGMFPSSNIAIWLIPNEILYKSSESWELAIGDINETIYTLDAAQAYVSNEPLPWDPTNSNHNSLILAPINTDEEGATIGGVYLELHSLIGPWSRKSLQRLFPAVHALTDQIASAIHQAEDYAQTLAYQSMAQELRLAGQIQASFFPNEFPNIPGWQLAVTLEPARGLSGDFFDLIPLPNDRLGLLIADVADKGFGAALYMALSRTLIRTYALEYPLRPDLVFSETNERVLNEARANLFITAFYGILDPQKNSLTYCNAGHNPPYLLHAQNGAPSEALIRTGMPIGIDVDSIWSRQSIHFNPGDCLILYTDGIPDAQNQDGEFYDEENLLKVAENNIGSSAYEIQDAILNSVRTFTNNSPQFDDITLMILAKDN